ncbi:MAG: TonB-dependent receptor plug domain-containing protein [Pseudomonadales bacterium]|nr:TonB-dependent receptor plug domain-containing protein [Pseudomonadales bacterium]
MSKPRKLGAWSGAAICSLALAALPSLPAIAADDEQMEEVVVTGSFIKRDSFDSASPLTVVDQAQIANNATPNLGEVMVNQTFNYGTDFQTNTYAARPQIGTDTAANLRGLGENATLELIDGHRTINGNFNNAIPQIAIERIDILKDGASATYGTDAVAGVVNIITRKNFSGAKVSAFYQQDKDDDIHEEVYEFIAGSDTEDGHITVAAAYRFRTDLQQTERPEYLRGGFERSGTGNPGTWQVPVRDATGAITGAEVSRDPGCGAATDESPGGSDIGLKGNFLSGDPRSVVEMAFGLPAGATGSNECGFHFGETWNFINPNEQ